MKIAFVNDTFLKGRGADQVIFELAKRLGKKHNITIIAFKADFAEENFKIKIVPGGKLVAGNWKDFLFLKKIYSVRKATEGYDLVSLHHAFLNIALWRKNLVVTYHGSPPISIVENGTRKAIRNMVSEINKFLLRFVPKTIAISKNMKDVLRKSKVPSKKIEIIYNGVAVDEFKPTNEDEEFMLYVGRLDKHKKVNELIRIARNINLKLKVIGGGPEEKNLKDLAEKLKAPVEFLGVVDNERKIREYQKCSFFVSASRFEGFGLIFIEAARCKKPSVAYKIHAIPEIILDKKTGFLAKNFIELQKFAKKLKESKKLRQKLGNEAYLYSQKFDWDKVAKEYEKVFEEVMNKDKGIRENRKNNK